MDYTTTKPAEARFLVALEKLARREYKGSKNQVIRDIRYECWKTSYQRYVNIPRVTAAVELAGYTNPESPTKFVPIAEIWTSEESKSNER